MIKAGKLASLRPDTVYKDGTGVTLSSIQDSLKEIADKYQIPIAFANDQIKSGGLLNSTTTDCLVVHHPDHPADYFRYAVSIRRQGIIAYVAVHVFGISKQIGKDRIAGDALENLKEGKIGTALISGILSIGRNKNKVEEEKRYYHAMEETVIEEVFG